MAPNGCGKVVLGGHDIRTAKREQIVFLSGLRPAHRQCRPQEPALLTASCEKVGFVCKLIA